MYKIIQGRWRKVKTPDEPLDAVAEMYLVSRMKRILPVFEDTDLSHDKLHIIANFHILSESQASILSRCLDLNEDQIKRVLTYINIELGK